MKVGKNHSIFENLVPIDKKIKPSQVHDDNLVKKSLDYQLFLPKIVTPASIKSNRSGRSGRRTPLRNSYGNKESVFEIVSKSNSPISFKCKIESDIRRIMKTVEKNEEDFAFNFPVRLNRIARKQNY
jgi:hypothetical protein